MFGVNFGRMGFLTSADGRPSSRRRFAACFAGEYKRDRAATLAASLAGGPQVAVNDVVVTSAELGRMVELGWEIGGEELGSQPCDGIICCTPSGSTAYNLSNGGPVLMWGLDAMAITFVAPHSLHARPLVVPRGHDLDVTNRTAAQHVAVLVDGKSVGDLEPGAANHRVDRGARRPRSPFSPRSASSPATTRCSPRPCSAGCASRTSS